MAETMAAASIGDYQLVGRVAATTSGAVWKARDAALERDVALKEVRGDRAALESLRHEARILSSLDHPNLVTVYGLHEEATDGTGWLVEAWVEGAPLESVLERCGTLTAPQAVGVLRGALQGLAYAHQRGLVHGDVAPGNVLLDTNGSTVLVDFGLAGPEGTRGGAGTPGFVSPESLTGAALSPAADVFSAGALLGLLLRGRPLFGGSTEADVLATQVRGTDPDLSGIEGGLAGVVQRATARAPEDRYPDAAAFLRALEEAAERDLGAGWLTSAGVAALVAATGTAVLVPIAAAAAPTPGIGAGAHAVRAARATGRIHRALGLKVAVGVVAVSVVAGVVVVATKKSPPSTQVTGYTSGAGQVSFRQLGCGPCSVLPFATTGTEDFSARSGTYLPNQPHGTVVGVLDGARLSTELEPSGANVPGNTALLTIYGLALGQTTFQTNAGVPGLTLQIAAYAPSTDGGPTFSIITGTGPNKYSEGQCTVTMTRSGPGGLLGHLSCPDVKVTEGGIVTGDASGEISYSYALTANFHLDRGPQSQPSTPSTTTPTPAGGHTESLSCPSASEVSAVMGSGFVVDPTNTIPDDCEYRPQSMSPDGTLQPGSALVSITLEGPGKGASLYDGSNSGTVTSVSGIGAKAGYSVSGQVTNLSVLTADGAGVFVGINRVGGASAGDVALAENLARAVLS